MSWFLSSRYIPVLVFKEFMFSQGIDWLVGNLVGERSHSDRKPEREGEIFIEVTEWSPDPACNFMGIHFWGCLHQQKFERVVFGSFQRQAQKGNKNGRHKSESEQWCVGKRIAGENFQSLASLVNFRPFSSQLVLERRESRRRGTAWLKLKPQAAERGAGEKKTWWYLVEWSVLGRQQGGHQQAQLGTGSKMHRKANKTNRDGKWWLLNRAAAKHVQSRVIQKEQLEKNPGELIPSAKERQKHHFKRFIGIDGPILPLPFPIKALTGKRSHIKDKGLVSADSPLG